MSVQTTEAAAAALETVYGRTAERTRVVGMIGRRATLSDRHTARVIVAKFISSRLRYALHPVDRRPGRLFGRRERDGANVVRR